MPADIDNLYAATLNGLPLQCQTTRDGFEKAISKQEIPYADGAVTDDLGTKARSIAVRCYFYEGNYPVHAQVIELLKVREILEFVHPVYGLLKVRLEALTVNHDDTIRAAELELQLVEDGRPQAQIRNKADIRNEAEKEFLNSVAEQKLSVAAKIYALGAKGEAFCESAIGSMGALMTTVANPANRLASLIDYGTDLPGRFVKEAALAVERYAIAYDALRGSPEAFMSRLNQSLVEFSTALDKFSAPAAAAGAARLAYEAAGFYSDGETAAGATKQAEGTAGFDYQGNKNDQDVYELMDSRQIELILALANEAIQRALQADRGNIALKRLAAALGAAALELKQTASNVITVRIENTTPLHLICLRYNLPYSAAERLLKLNPGIKDPNRVKGEVLIYV